MPLSTKHCNFQRLVFSGILRRFSSGHTHTHTQLTFFRLPYALRGFDGRYRGITGCLTQRNAQLATAHLLCITSTIGDCHFLFFFVSVTAVACSLEWLLDRHNSSLEIHIFLTQSLVASIHVHSPCSSYSHACGHTFVVAVSRLHRFWSCSDCVNPVATNSQQTSAFLFSQWVFVALLFWYIPRSICTLVLHFFQYSFLNFVGILKVLFVRVWAIVQSFSSNTSHQWAELESLNQMRGSALFLCPLTLGTLISAEGQLHNNETA